MTSASELRPITITEAPAKLLEKVVKRRINSSVKELINEDQHAYQEKDSAEIALVCIINSITEQLNKEPSTIPLLMVDLQKAFDSVEHSLLLSTIESSNTPDFVRFLPWIHSFLSQRK